MLHLCQIMPNVLVKVFAIFGVINRAPATTPAHNVFCFCAVAHILAPVAYLGYGSHGSCHGRHFDSGSKIAWKKMKFMTCRFLTQFFAQCNH